MKKLLFTLLVVLAALLPVMAFAEAPVVLAGYEMNAGDTLYCNNADVSPDATALAGVTGTAALTEENGKLVLTLTNFDNRGKPASGTVLQAKDDLTIQLVGNNTLSNPSGGIHSDDHVTVTGDGTLNMEGYSAVGGHSIFTMESGNVNIKGTIALVVNDFNMSGGSLTATTKNTCLMLDNANISGGRLNLNAFEPSWNNCCIAGSKIIITGGVLDMYYADGAIRASQKMIIDADMLPDGAEIIKKTPASFNELHIYLDYTSEAEGYRSIHLEKPVPPAPDPVDPAPAPAAPVPTTGDNANIALWTALAVMSAAAMLIIRRRRTV